MFSFPDGFPKMSLTNDGSASDVWISFIILSTFPIISVNTSVSVPWFSKSLLVSDVDRNRFGVIITAKLYGFIKFYSEYVETSWKKRAK